MFRSAITAGLMLVLGQGLLAQTATENLQSAVEIYNAMREYQNGFDSKTLKQSNIDDMKTRMDKGVLLLDKVIQEGNADQIKTARYFRNNFKYEYGFVLGMKGENAKSYEVMKEIEKDLASFSSSDFPLRYEFFGKNYVISWDNFAPTQAEYLTGMAEICYNLSKYEEAIRFNKKAIAHPNTTEWLRYVAVNKMLDIHAKNSSFLTPNEYSDYALQTIKEYDKLSEENKQAVKENEYQTVKRGMDILIKDAQGKASTQAISRCAEAALICVKYDPDNASTLTLFELCYRNAYQGELGWHRVAQDYAQVAHAKSKSGSQFKAATAEYVGVAATDRLAAAAGLTDCETLKEVADLYSYWGKTAKQSEYNKKAKDCLGDREKAAAKAQKAARRADRNFNLYLGANIFPLLNTNPKRDYGGVVDFVFKKSAIEFGYAIINRNQENIFDLVLSEAPDADQDNISRWDGFKLHFQPKFFTKNSDHGYIGILLGYNEKNFDSMAVSVIRDVDGAYSLEGFKPGVKQYVGMLNFGGLLLGKGVGLDFNCGIGVNYSTFGPGNPLDRKEYTIDNPLLEYRKDHYWGFVLHIGFTMGLNFGPGND